MTKQIYYFSEPANDFLKESINFIRSYLKSLNEENSKINELISSIDINSFQFLETDLAFEFIQAKKYSGFEKIYEKLLEKIVMLYNDSSKDGKFLPVFGVLLGDKELRATCQKQKFSLFDKEKDNILNLISIYSSKKERKEKITFPEDIPHLIKKKEIGSGSFSTVYKGKLKVNDKKLKVALKQFNIKKNDGNGQPSLKTDDIKKQIEIYSKLDNDNIVKLIGVIDNSFGIKLIMEYIKKDLSEVIRNQQCLQNLNKEKAHQIVLDIALGLQYLHLVGVLHKDLKTNNILVTGDERAKIADFDFSDEADEKNENLSSVKVGTFGYLAPEIFNSGKIIYSFKTDVFALAVLLWEFAVSKIIFDEYEDIENFQKNLSEGKRPEINEKEEISPKLKGLIEQCWDQDPKKRPGTKEIVKTLEENPELFKHFKQK